MQQRLLMRAFLGLAALILTYFVFQIFRPFILPIFLAAILVSLLYPVYEGTDRKLGGRSNWASLLTCLAFTLLVVAPIILLLILVTRELTQFYGVIQRAAEGGELERFIQNDVNPKVAPLLNWVEQRLGVAEIDLLGTATAGLQKVGPAVLRGSTAILSGFFQLLVSFFIMVMTMFFLFRDGSRLGAELKSWNPLTARYEQLFVSKFRDVARATILGSVLTALAQGLAAGLVYWVLGLSNVILWGSLTALLSLVPLFGTALVWVPWTIYLLATGAMARAILLVLFSVLFVGMIDNFLRPLLIEGRAKMHTLVVFFAIMGGVSYFGMVGLLLGPIVVALALTFVEVYKLEFREELQNR